MTTIKSFDTFCVQTPVNDCCHIAPTDDPLNQPGFWSGSGNYWIEDFEHEQHHLAAWHDDYFEYYLHCFNCTFIAYCLEAFTAMKKLDKMYIDSIVPTEFKAAFFWENRHYLGSYLFVL